jgi:uncharacterized Fe-S cluster protein YjdI
MTILGAGQMGAADPTRGHEPTRTYADDSIEVEWEPRLCSHTENCVRGEVFDRDRGADADRVAATVIKAFCDNSHRKIGFKTEEHHEQ